MPKRCGPTPCNFIVFKKGAKATGNKLMLTAHMDEVGFIVNDITEDGYLKFAPVGGIDPRVVIGKRVSVVWDGSRAQSVSRRIIWSVRKRKNVPKFEDMYIDIGARDRADAEAAVSLGLWVAFESDAVEFGYGMFKAKAIDDRVDVPVMPKLLEEELHGLYLLYFPHRRKWGPEGLLGAAFSVTLRSRWSWRGPRRQICQEPTATDRWPSPEGVRFSRSWTEARYTTANFLS